MASRLKYQIIAVVSIVLCAGFCFTLFRGGDSFERFIPFLPVLTGQGLDAGLYDMLFVGGLFATRALAQRLHVTPRCIATIAHLRPTTMAQASALTFAAALTYAWLWPVLGSGPLRGLLRALIHGPTAVRRCCVFFAPVITLFWLAALARRVPPPIHVPRPPAPPPMMPPPPASGTTQTW